MVLERKPKKVKGKGRFEGAVFACVFVWGAPIGLWPIRLALRPAIGKGACPLVANTPAVVVF